MPARPFKTPFITAIRTLVRPIVRQLIAYGVSYPAFSQMVKELYIEIADAHFVLPYKRQTDSRVALITGINRKEVARQRGQEGRVASPIEVEDTIVTHVIGRWMAGPPYATPDGVPRRLVYESDTPRVASFSRLVRELSVDIPVRAVLDELIRLGSVELLPSGEVVLRHEGHLVTADTEAKLALLGSDPAELFSTIMHNIETPERPWLQRKVVYDNIGADALEQLEAESRRLGEEFLRRANALLSSYDRDRRADAPSGARWRVLFGAHFFAEPRPSDAPPPSGAKSSRAQRLPGRIRRSK